MKLENIFILLTIVVLNFSAWAKECTGHFVNPITDVCWDCLFPMTLGSMELYDSGIAKDTKNPDTPVCACTSPIRVGIIGGFWEPVRIVDVSHEPYCFTNMGGLKIDVGLERNMGARVKQRVLKYLVGMYIIIFILCYIGLSYLRILFA